MRLAASLERGGEHPLTTPIVKEAEGRRMKLSDTRDFWSVTGKGVRGAVEGRKVLLGNAALLKDEAIESEQVNA